MKEIAIITHYDLSIFRGGEKFIINLANALSNIGCKVRIYSYPFKRGKVNVRKYLLKDVEYISDFSFKKIDADTSYYIYAPLVYKIFLKDKSQKKIAGLHGFVIIPELSSQDVWNINPIRFYKLHGLKALFAYYYEKIMRKRDLNNFDFIHIINPYMKYFLPNSLIQKTVYIPLWTNYLNDNFVRKESENDKFTILILGSNNYLKGKDICEKILQYFHNKKEIEILSNVQFNNKKIKLLEFIKEEEMPKFLSSVNVLLYPSRLDTFGLTIIESLNCGTPVITSDILAHKIFSYPVILCSTLQDYLKNILKLFHIWKEGLYSIIRKKALLEGKKFSKDQVFPKYRDFLC